MYFQRDKQMMENIVFTLLTVTSLFLAGCDAEGLRAQTLSYNLTQ